MLAKKSRFALWVFSAITCMCTGVQNSSSYRIGGAEGESEYFETIDFQYIEKKIVVEVYVNTKGPYNFVIDTGIHPSGISLKAAEDADIHLGPKAGNVGGFGTRNIPYYPADISSLRIGDLIVPHLETIATDMEHLNRFEIPIHGILGYSFLKNRVTTIDYLKKRIYLSNRLPNNFLSGKSTEEVVKFPLLLAGGMIPTLPNFTIQGKKVNAWLDTGAGTKFGLRNSEARRLGLVEMELTEKAGKGVGARGEFEVNQYYAENMAIGAFKQDSVIGFGHDLGMSNVVGNAFFEEYTLTLDYVDRMVYFELNN